MKTDMSRLNESTDQDMDAINKVSQEKCDVCGKETKNLIWNHNDSWTKWLRYGCGCNVMYCDNEKCKAGCEEIRKRLVSENRKKAEESERNTLRNLDEQTLPRVRSRYFIDFNASSGFREWVVSVVGKDRAKEILDVPCERCGEYLGPIHYTFEDRDGNRSLKTMQEIEDYCYSKLGRDKEKSPLQLPEYGKTADIEFQRIIWDYYERKGWDHKTKDYSPGSHFRKALDATRDDFWAWGSFIYYMPERYFWGKFVKRDGDWAQIVQTNSKQLAEEHNELTKRYKDKHGDNYCTAEFFVEFRKIKAKKKWSYFCGKECMTKSTDANGTIFI